MRLSDPTLYQLTASSTLAHYGLYRLLSALIMGKCEAMNIPLPKYSMEPDRILQKRHQNDTKTTFAHSLRPADVEDGRKGSSLSSQRRTPGSFIRTDNLSSHYSHFPLPNRFAVRPGPFIETLRPRLVSAGMMDAPKQIFRTNERREKNCVGRSLKVSVSYARWEQRDLNPRQRVSTTEGATLREIMSHRSS